MLCKWAKVRVSLRFHEHETKCDGLMRYVTQAGSSGWRWAECWFWFPRACSQQAELLSGVERLLPASPGTQPCTLPGGHRRAQAGGWIRVLIHRRALTCQGAPALPESTVWAWEPGRSLNSCESVDQRTQGLWDQGKGEGQAGAIPWGGEWPLHSFRCWD